jgi:hypothetical protein
MARDPDVMGTLPAVGLSCANTGHGFPCRHYLDAVMVDRNGGLERERLNNAESGLRFSVTNGVEDSGVGLGQDQAVL